ncbi:hypothetical protein FI667_g5330, partial [Globisporangium splendens]
MEIAVKYAMVVAATVSVKQSPLSKARKLLCHRISTIVPRIATKPPMHKRLHELVPCIFRSLYKARGNTTGRTSNEQRETRHGAEVMDLLARRMADVQVHGTDERGSREADGRGHERADHCGQWEREALWRVGFAELAPGHGRRAVVGAAVHVGGDEDAPEPGRDLVVELEPVPAQQREEEQRRDHGREQHLVGVREPVLSVARAPVADAWRALAPGRASPHPLRWVAAAAYGDLLPVVALGLSLFAFRGQQERANWLDLEEKWIFGVPV